MPTYRKTAQAKEHHWSDDNKICKTGKTNSSKVRDSSKRRLAPSSASSDDVEAKKMSKTLSEISFSIIPFIEQRYIRASRVIKSPKHGLFSSSTYNQPYAPEIRRHNSEIHCKSRRPLVLPKVEVSKGQSGVAKQTRTSFSGTTLPLTPLINMKKLSPYLDCFKEVLHDNYAFHLRNSYSTHRNGSGSFRTSKNLRRPLIPNEANKNYTKKTKPPGSAQSSSRPPSARSVNTPVKTQVDKLKGSVKSSRPNLKQEIPGVHKPVSSQSNVKFEKETIITEICEDVCSTKKPSANGMDPGKLYTSDKGTKKLRESKQKLNLAKSVSSEDKVGRCSNKEASKKTSAKTIGKIKGLKTISQQKDYSREVNNYYEWDRFCLLRKYRNDSIKLKEQMKELEKIGKDKYSISKLWKQAEIFKNRLQNEREAIGKACDIPTSPENMNSKYSQKSGEISIEPNASTSSTPPRNDSGIADPKIGLESKSSMNPKNIKPSQAPQKQIKQKGNLVLPPRVPHLAFFVPDMSTGMIKYAPLKPKATTNKQQPDKLGTGESVNSASPRQKLEGSYEDIKKYVGNVNISPGASNTRKSVRTPPRSPPGLADSGILEVVSSYIPESRTKLKSRFTIRNERFSFSSLRLAV